MDQQKRAKDMCIFVSPVNAYRRPFIAQEVVKQKGGLKGLYFKEKSINSHPFHCLCDEPFKSESIIEETKSMHRFNKLGSFLPKLISLLRLLNIQSVISRYRLI